MIFNSERRRNRQLLAAEGYLSLGMPDHALAALAADSNDANDAETAYEIHVLRGDALRVKLDHHGALECFSRAHDLNPESLDALMGMAWCYKRIDRVDLSIETMRKASLSHPKTPIVLYNLACYYSLAGIKEQALSWLGRALRMDRSLAKLVPKETDFDPLRDDPDFRHLLTLSAEH